jgi:hypothetical protein
MLYVQATIKKIAAKKLSEEYVGASRYSLMPIIAVAIMAIRQHTILTDSINIERADVGKNVCSLIVEKNAKGRVINGRKEIKNIINKFATTLTLFLTTRGASVLPIVCQSAYISPLDPTADIIPFSLTIFILYPLLLMRIPSALSSCSASRTDSNVPISSNTFPFMIKNFP